MIEWSRTPAKVNFPLPLFCFFISGERVFFSSAREASLRVSVLGEPAGVTACGGFWRRGSRDAQCAHAVHNIWSELAVARRRVA